jgi:hypothetical protein
MDEQDIVAKAEALLANVTPGAWAWDDKRQFMGVRNGKQHAWVIDVEYEDYGGGGELKVSNADAAFIAAAPLLVRELLAEVKRLRASERADTPPMEFEVPTDMKWPPSPPNNESEDAK